MESVKDYHIKGDLDGVFGVKTHNIDNDAIVNSKLADNSVKREQIVSMKSSLDILKMVLYEKVDTMLLIMLILKIMLYGLVILVIPQSLLIN